MELSLLESWSLEYGAATSCISFKSLSFLAIASEELKVAMEVNRFAHLRYQNRGYLASGMAGFSFGVPLSDSFLY
jgi:hypothetical protein